jgi:hypothetical protein
VWYCGIEPESWNLKEITDAINETLSVSFQVVLDKEEHLIGPKELSPRAHVSSILGPFEQVGTFLKAILEASGQVFSLAPLAVMRICPVHRVSECANDFALWNMPSYKLPRLSNEVIGAEFANRTLSRTSTKMRRVPFQSFVVLRRKKVGFFYVGKPDMARQNLMQPGCCSSRRSNTDKIRQPSKGFTAYPTGFASHLPTWPLFNTDLKIANSSRL